MGYRLKIVWLTAALFTSFEADAQTVTASRATTARKVALIAVDEIPGGQKTRIVRRQHVRPQDLILVSGDASPNDLAAAINVLNGLRFQFGDTLTAGVEVSPTNHTPSASWSRSPYSNWISAQLTRLRAGRHYRVDGIGVRRTVLITLPPPRGRLEIMEIAPGLGARAFATRPPL